MINLLSWIIGATEDQPDSWTPVAEPRTHGGRWAPFAQAVCVAGLLSLAMAVKLSFRDFFSTGTPFLLFFGPIALAAWWLGAVGGVVAALLSAFLGFQYFMPHNGDNLLRVLLFLVECAFLVLIAHVARSERRKAIALSYRAHSVQTKLRAVLEASDDGITVQDRRGRLLYANAKAARLSGFASAEEFMSTPMTEVLAKFDLLDEGGKALSVATLPGRSVLEGEAVPEKLVRFRVKATGEERWSLIRAKAAGGDPMKPAFAVNIFQDVTERRGQEERLRVSREWFSMALKSVADAVLATDETGIVTFMNPAAEALTGWTLAEAQGLSHHAVFNIVNEETRLPIESPVDLALREGQPVNLAGHTILITKSKTEVFIDDSAAPIKDTSNKLVGTVLVFRDVSSQRAKERRRLFIAKSATELGSSLDYESTLATVVKLAVPAVADWCAVDLVEEGSLRRLAVAHIDPNKVAFVRELESRYPPDPHAATGTPNILRTGEPEMVPEIPLELLAAAARDAEHLRLIEKLELCSYIGVPIRRGSETIGVITLAMAESRRRYTEDDLATAEALADRAAAAIDNARLYANQISARQRTESARADAESASRAKDEFLAMLGHELRNPLAPILTALHLMALRAPDTFVRERTVIDRQVRHVVRLVDDLLDISRITRGKVELQKQPVVIAELVAKAVEMASPLIEQKQHALVVDVPEGLVVDGDAERLAQVLTNLLTNAAKYTDAGGRIDVTAKRADHAIEISVRDNGMGIAPEMLPRVFELFAQEAQAIDRAQGGLGLGLAIVKSLVHLHKGMVTANSEGVGRGSEFSISLPPWEGEVISTSAREVTPLKASVPESHRRTILIVDDNIDALELLSEVLNESGYQTISASDGPSGLALAVEEVPDLALIDIGLPVMDGYEVATRLRANDSLKHVKLIAVTGYGQISDRERAFHAGFDAHLVKPVSVPSVLEAVERLMASLPRRSALRVT